MDSLIIIAIEAMFALAQWYLVLLAALASPIERLAKLPRGAIKGFVDSLKINTIDDPLAIRAILPQPLLSFRQAVERALMIS
jgi:hypothetical protein